MMSESKVFKIMAVFSQCKAGRRKAGLYLFVSLVVVMLSGCQATTMAMFQVQNQLADYNWDNGKSAVVPFKTINRHIIVPVSVNGSEPLQFVLDSGAYVSIITQTLATDKLDIKTTAEIEVSGTGDGDNPSAFVAPDVTLRVGGFEISEFNVIYTPTQTMPFDTIEETYFDGVLGADFFQRNQVEIDYGKKHLIFHKPSDDVTRQRLSNGWLEVPMEVNNNTPFVHTTVANGDVSKQVKVMLDTGSTGSLSLFNSVMPKGLSDGKGFMAKTRGISGYSQNQVKLLDQVAITKGAELSQVETLFRISGENPQDDSHGIMGNALLRHFNVLIDFTNEKLLLTPNENYKQEKHHRSLGIRFMPLPNGVVVKEHYSFANVDGDDLAVNTKFITINGIAINHDNFDQVLQSVIESNDTVEMCPASKEKTDCLSIPVVTKPFG